MARDFIIYKADVGAKETVVSIDSYSPLLNDYSIVVGNYMTIVDNVILETIYEPISLQIKGPISLRSKSEPYKLTIEEK